MRPRWRRRPSSARREYEQRWRHGGLWFLGAYKDLMVDADGQRHGGRVRARQDPRAGARPRARRAAGAQEHHRLQAAVRRHRLLRDLQPAERDAGRRQRQRRSRRSRRTGVQANGREHEVDAIVFATGFDAMTGALLKIDIRGRGGLALAREMERGPAHLPRRRHGGLSQPVHHHRPGQPFGAHQHAAHHRAARRLDRRLHGAHARARPPRASSPARRPRTSGSAHVSEVAGRTLRYTCSSWYLGANIPGKPRVFMPYIGGFPKYVAEVQRGRRRRLRGLRAELAAACGRRRRVQ